MILGGTIMLVQIEFTYEQTWQRESAGVVFSFYPNSVTEVEIKEPSAEVEPPQKLQTSQT